MPTVTVKFTNIFDNSCFFLSNVYGPSHAAGKLAFITWFINLDTSEFDEWIIAGDFNLYRSMKDRNKPGDDPRDMNLFNDFISYLELVDIPFSGRTFTWSNMQNDPLLIKLDWVLCNANWSLQYPSTSGQPLSKPISDHVPYVISFGSSIPKSCVFIFENFQADHADFLKVVQLYWNSTAYYSNAARTLSAKFKQTRLGLKQWRKSFQNHSRLLHNSEWVLLLLDGLEEQRPLSTLEAVLRGLVKDHIAKLLEAKRLYWKQRNTVRWVKLGDENTSFFQAMASIYHRKNKIASLSIPGDILVTNHEHKVGILWEAFKNRLGVTEFQGIAYDLTRLLERVQLDHLADDFNVEEIKAVISDMPLNHAPGSDGFNSKFIKKMLAYRQAYFLRLFNDFFSNFIDLTSINSSLITLIPNSQKE